MPVPPRFPSIPTATKDPEALLATVEVLKQVVEMLTGQNNVDRYASHVFMDAVEPVPNNRGDLWISEGAQYSLNVWNGTQWLKVADLITPAASAASYDMIRQFHFRRHR